MVAFIGGFVILAVCMLSVVVNSRQRTMLSSTIVLAFAVHERSTFDVRDKELLSRTTHRHALHTVLWRPVGWISLISVLCTLWMGADQSSYSQLLHVVSAAAVSATIVKAWFTPFKPEWIVGWAEELAVRLDTSLAEVRQEIAELAGVPITDVRFDEPYIDNAGNVRIDASVRQVKQVGLHRPKHRPPEQTSFDFMDDK